MKRRGWRHAGDSAPSRYQGETIGWAIAHSHGLMHTNWLLGVGRELWPGMLPCGLFVTRDAARKALRSVPKCNPVTSVEKADAVLAAMRGAPEPWPRQPDMNQPLRSQLPFTPRIVRVTITEEHYDH